MKDESVKADAEVQKAVEEPAEEGMEEDWGEDDQDAWDNYGQEDEVDILVK